MIKKVFRSAKQAHDAKADEVKLASINVVVILHGVLKWGYADV